MEIDDERLPLFSSSKSSLLLLNLSFNDLDKVELDGTDNFLLKKLL